MDPLVGKLVTEVEVKRYGEKHYEMLRHYVEVPIAVPQIYKSVKVIKGDGNYSGCVKEWDYVVSAGSPLIVEEQTTYMDEIMTVSHNMVGGALKKDYKKFNLILAVSPNSKDVGCGGIVRFSIEYEKNNADSPAPITYIALCQKIIEGINAYLYSSE
ncbi:hypothetical protein MKX03_007916 [Papaver bracteatum]|nr:hypothetical protein MKX03_007916 [Papaver bracteatum]